MLEMAIGLVRSSGRAAAPLALATWGYLLLPTAISYPAPFGMLISWLCFSALAAGILAACVMVLRAAFAPSPRR